MTESATRQLQLDDGRTLSFSDIGTGKSGTWIHCHGIPGSRYELSYLNGKLRAAGLRVIVPDRPGYGDSTPCPQYGFAQHTADLCQLASHLGLERFSLSGFSGGGVFAMAAAHDLAERTESLAIAGTPAVPLMSNPFACASELTANAWQAALADPDKLALELQALTESAETLSAALISAVGPEESGFMHSEPFQQSFRKSNQAALHQGSTESARALVRDSRLTAGQWPFRPEDIDRPIKVIHGERDGLVHREHQRALTGRLSGAESVTVERQGHFSAVSFIWH